MIAMDLPNGVDVMRYQLKEEDIVALDGADCVVCLEVFRQQAIVAVLRCRHVMDFDCAAGWLDQVNL